MFDAVIVGGSSAGLSAALVLGRARRRVAVFDDGKPCNRFSHASHGFLTRDGITPAELVRIAREQLQPYETVEFWGSTVTAVKPVLDGFEIESADGAKVSARKLLLATGFRDELPALENIEPFWGQGVFHCPYCDGWENRDQPIVVYGDSPMAFHQTIMLRNWTPNLTLVLSPLTTLPQHEKDVLTKHGVQLIEKPIARLDGADGQLQGIVFEDGTALACNALFIRPKTHHRTTFAYDLGCTINDNGIIQVDALGHTSVPNLFAAGDIANMGRSVAAAVAGGSMAAAGINHDLIFEEFS